MIKKQSDIQLVSKKEPRYRITATLLNSWQYIWDCKDYVFEGENDEICYEDKLAIARDGATKKFIDLLNRIPVEDNEAMRKGREYEDLVCSGYDNVFSPLVKNGAFQVKLTKDVNICGLPITLYGVLDVLKGGRIMDIKRVGRYQYPKYKTSHQHPMYLYLAPNAIDFTYLICDDGIESKVEEKQKTAHNLERYTRENCEDIIEVCERFINWLIANDLIEIFKEKWQMKY